MTRKPYVRKRGPKPNIAISNNVGIPPIAPRRRYTSERNKAICKEISESIISGMTKAEAIEALVKAEKHLKRDGSQMTYERCERILENNKLSNTIGGFNYEVHHG